MKRHLFSQVASFVFTLALVAGAGCASSTDVAEEDVVLADDDTDALASTTRGKVLDAVRLQLTGAAGSLKGAAFLKRGDKLVFVVRRYVERGQYVVFYGDALGRRVSSSGRTIDYKLKTSDYAGSAMAAAAAEGLVDGTHVETLLVKTGASYQPVTSGTGADAYPLFQFASTDTLVLELECKASSLGFLPKDFGYASSVKLCRN